MASGVAVVTLPVGVLDDVVVHGVTGLLISPGNPAELPARSEASTRSDFFGKAWVRRVRSLCVVALHLGSDGA